MSQLAFVQHRLESGDKIKFCHGYYGDQWIELRRWWFFWPKTRVNLTPQETSDLKSVLRTQQREH